ncbi:MAG: glutathione S-transferase family protein [Pseudomonadota bacterium]
MKLYIGNKNYSSWSLRVWLTMKVCGVPFEEDLRPFDVANNYADFFEFAPHGKVPVLNDAGVTVWETLAILEYLADRFPRNGLWPADPRVKADARSIANEMHGGFMALRGACPMNMRRKIERIAIDEAVRKDIVRIEAIWDERLAAHGGPFLYGKDFTIADGMYAPVVNRLAIYQLSDHPAVRAYSDAITALPAWQEWADASAQEPWVVDIDEVYA